jgi:hypothetical protein
MSTRKIYALRRVNAILALIMLVVGLGPSLLAAQSPLGMPYIGGTHLSFYATELTSDGVGPGMAKLYGGRYGHRFGAAASKTHFALSLQVAARDFESTSDGVFDVAVGASLTRRADEIDPRLSASLGVSASARAWGFDEADTGIAHVSVPVAVGLAYDVRIGAVTFAPFVSPSLARYDARTYLNDVRMSQKTGWDARFTAGMSARMKEVVLSTSSTRGEHGLPNESRWAFSAGISF